VLLAYQLASVILRSLLAAFADTRSDIFSIYNYNLIVSLSVCSHLVMASSSSKKRGIRNLELVSLGRSSYASHSAISKLLAHVSEHGLPDTFDRSAQFRARKEVCRSDTTGYGPLVVNREMALAAGGTVTGSFQNPLAFFAYHCKHSAHYSKVVQNALTKFPCEPGSPWRLILYQDGVDPSDGLAKNHSRKSAVSYWAFAEFGIAALGHEEVWGTICVCRFSKHQKLAGTVSCLFEHVLSMFFGDTHDIMRSGVSVQLYNGGHAQIFARASILLADLPALKECTYCKGHAGMICCPCCLNAVQHDTKESIPMHLLTSAAISIANFDLKKFTRLSRETLHEITRKISQAYVEFQAGTISKEKFELAQKIRGWNYTPANVILNNRFQLDLPNLLMFDWAHLYVHDGLGDVEFGLCMHAMQKASKYATGYGELGEYVKQFTFPKSAPGVGHLFADEKNKNNYSKKSFTCTGSEFLTLAPIMHRYFERVVKPRGEQLDKVNSMLAVLSVVMLLTSLKTGTVTAEHLNTAIVTHLALFLVAWGEQYVRPKHHYSIHLGPMLKWFGFLLATFTHERKHRLVTRYCRDRKNLANWDMSAIEEITCHQVWQLSLPFMQACETAKPRGKILLPLREAYPGCSDEDFLICSGIACNNGSCSSGDIVTFLQEGIQVGQVLVSVAVKSENNVYISLRL
jgi:hypothetical protein